MSAETLRRAAALMRERAEAATPGPWGVDPLFLFDVVSDRRKIASAHNAHKGNGEHIASWHPAVALAVADWLYAEAAWGGCEGCGHSQQRCDEWTAEPDVIKCCPDCDHAPHALTVARAYLGESA